MFYLKLAFLLFVTVHVYSQNQGAERFSEVPIWRQAVGGSVLSVPSVQAQSAVVALDGGNIRAYSSSGTPLWNFTSGGRIAPHITRSREGTSYFSRTNGIFFAVNRSGRELWRRNLGSPLSAKVVVGWDGRIFVPAENRIFCFTAAGTLLWSITLEEDFSVAPTLDRSGGILFALLNNEVYKADPFGNVSVWKLERTPSVLLSMENQNILILYADGTMTLLEMYDESLVSAAYDSDSSVLPRFPSAISAAAIERNNVAALLEDGTLAFLSLDEMSILWRSDTHIRELSRSGTRTEAGAELLIDDRGIFVLSRNGATGFSKDGRRQWYMILQNTAAIPALGSDGILYSGGRDWIFYAYRVEAPLLPDHNSIYGPASEGNYWTSNSQAFLTQGFPLDDNELKPLLERIGFEIHAGRVGANEPAWKSLLTRAATNNRFSLRYRLDALNLLGRLGSKETVPWLSNFIYRENDSALRAAAANAIGNIGVDPEGFALRTFQFLIIGGGIGTRDEQVLTAIASATGALCRFSGPPLSEAGIRILNLLSMGSQPPSVRAQAGRELASLL